MPTARAQAAVASVNGVLYVAGGFACGTGAPLTTVEMFDPATNAWTTAAPLPAGQAGAVGATVNGTLLHDRRRLGRRVRLQPGVEHLDHGIADADGTNGRRR